MHRLMSGASLIAMSSLFGLNAVAQDAAEPKVKRLKSVTVTATKRSESAQNIPVAVNALGEQELEELGVDTFDDYLQQLPGVTSGGSGPGQNTIYIRGIASTTPNLTTAGVAGLAPNVAFYLDEQPLAQPGRNLDVYAADLERIEVLSGPQGTLFGASSQAGTVRLITNKPSLNGFAAGFDGGVSFTDGGDASNKLEFMLNVPVSENFALRGVAYRDEQGGYIDNVPGTISYADSARFRPEGTVRSNGVPVSARRGGVQTQAYIDGALAAGDTLVGGRIADLSNVNFLTADNQAFVEEDFNDTVYTGFRLSGLYEFNTDWSLLVSHAQQQIESDGVFFSDTEASSGLDDWEVQRYQDERLEDDFQNTSWTLEGRLGMLEALYTGAYTERDSEQRVDYTDYLFVGQYLPYYVCDSTVTYPEYNSYAAGFTNNLPEGDCAPPNLYVDSVTETKVFTQELRFNTPSEYRLRATAGAFYSDLELKERNDFTYIADYGLGPNQIDVFSYFGVQPGFPDNFPYMTGPVTDAGPFPPGVIFRNDVQRTDEQIGIFGEATYDLTDQFAITFGARYYDVEVDLDGSANASFCNGFSSSDANSFGTDITDLYNGDGQFTFRNDCSGATNITFTEGQTFDEIKAILTAADPYSIGRGAFTNAPNAISDVEIQAIVNALSAPDKAATDGVIIKLTGEWRPMQDVLFYATYSEGYRPGLLNRPGGAPGAGGFVVPFALDTDDVTNYELGWKTELFENSLRFNGSAFFVEIENLQTTIFDPSISNLFFSANAANAEVMGIEGDFTWAPESVDGLTLAGAFSILDTEVTDVLVPTNDVVAGSPLAFAPEFQGNLRARYTWDVDWFGKRMDAHVMPQVVYSGSSFTDIIEINKMEIDSYTMFGLTAGVTADNWGAELFANNLTNEAAELSGNYVYDRERVTQARPRTIGIRVSYDY